MKEGGSDGICYAFDPNVFYFMRPDTVVETLWIEMSVVFFK